MTSTTTRRLVRAAALSLAPAAMVSVAAPSFAGDSATAPGSETVARAGTGALVDKTLSARTVLTSTSGKKLTLSIGATGSSQGTRVTIGLGQGSESHMWTFKARATDFKVGSTGAGTLTLSNTQTGNRGKLSLKFSPIEAFRKKSCGGQLASKSRKMSVSGIAYFKTGTKAWGNVGRSASSIKLAGGNNVTWTYDVECPTPGGSTPACSKATTWSAFVSDGTTMTSIGGSSNGTSASVSAFRNVTLSTPAGASRFDMTSRSVPVPTFSSTGSSASLVARSGGGSMTVNGDGGWVDDYACRNGSSTVTGHDTSWYGTVTNDSPAFSVPAQVFGAFSVPSDSTGTIGRSTF